MPPAEASLPDGKDSAESFRLEERVRRKLAVMENITFSGYSYDDEELWRDCFAQRGDRWWQVAMPGVGTTVFDEDDEDVGDALIDVFDDQCCDDYLEADSYLCIEYWSACHERRRYLFIKRTLLPDLRIVPIEDPYEFFHMGETDEETDRREDIVRQWWKRWRANGMRRPD